MNTQTATGLVGRRYVERIAELEAEGMTTSDAQAALDAELLAAEMDHVDGPTIAHVKRDPLADHDHIYVEQD